MSQILSDHEFYVVKEMLEELIQQYSKDGHFDNQRIKMGNLKELLEK